MPRPKTRTGSDAAADAALAEEKKAHQRLVGAVALCLVAAIVVPMLLESEPRTGLRPLPMTVETATGTTRAEQPAIQPPSMDDMAAARSAPPSQVMMLEEGVAGQPVVPDPGTQAPHAPGDLPGTVVAHERREPPPAPAAPEPLARPPAPSSPRGNGPAAPVSGNARPGGSNPPPRPAAGSQSQPRPGAAGAALPPPPVDRRPDVLARLINQVDSGAVRVSPPGAGRQVRRFLVQIGAYSNLKSAQTAVERVSRAGFSAYQETVKTANGDWIRVRVGPFGSRDDAERAQQALKQAGITAALIAL